MNYRIVENPGFRIVGKAIRVPIQHNENQTLIPQFWDTCVQNGTIASLIALIDRNALLGPATLGVCTDFAADMSAFSYLIGIESAERTPEGMVECLVPASAWAVFESIGPMPGAIQAVWGYIMSEFLPAGEYAHAPAPDIEVYPEGDPSGADYRSEIWVPVIRTAGQQSA